ncbi:MAG: SPFH domain-containing protein [Myxococcales bacterium]|nr:SPFH domain-containing protein [Myxococcales bacterium]
MPSFFGIRYLKAPPTTFVLQYANGRCKRQGLGLSFLYYAPSSSIALVSMVSEDVPFAFTEQSADYQTLTVQGQLTYRVIDAKALAEQLDYTVDAAGRYHTDDPQKLRERLVRSAQTATRAVLQKLALRAALGAAEELTGTLLESLRENSATGNLGVEVLSVTVLSVRPSPEMARALEAEAREALLRAADEAIYARRNAAVEQERIIKENELQTAIAVEQKQLQIRETVVRADIAVETQRAELIEKRVANDKLSAESKAYALETMLAPVRGMDWKTLAAVTGGDAKLMIGMAFRELAENAQKIGELNITPDLLQSLIGDSSGAGSTRNNPKK